MTSEPPKPERLLGEREALRKLLGWLDGFQDSQLYEDYRRTQPFTDEEYAQVFTTLETCLNAGETLYVLSEVDLRWHFLEAVCPECQKGLCDKSSDEHDTAPWDALTPEEHQRLFQMAVDGLSSGHLGDLVNDILTDTAMDWVQRRGG